MTISTTNRIAGPFSGDGVSVNFPFAFKVFQAADLLVTENDGTDPPDSELDYTVALNADQDNNPGGTVSLTYALAVGTTLTITSDIPALQTLELSNGGSFYPSVINAALDLLTILIQQLVDAQAFDLQLAPGTPGGHVLRYLPCAGAVPGNTYTAPGTVIAVAYNGVLMPLGVDAPTLSYTVTGGNEITLNFQTEAGYPPDRIDAFIAT
jgi:hypothetical protein